MKNIKTLWVALILSVSGAFFILGFFGQEVYRQAPPLPERVVTESGQVLMTKDQILDGQQVWQSIGGQQVGSIWGHGAYQAPDWSADWLHRESIALLNVWSNAEEGQAFGDLSAEQRASLEGRLKVRMRNNGYDAETGDLVVSADRERATAETAVHYRALFGDSPAMDALREDYAIHSGAIKDPERLDRMMNFFFWTAWACVTERPGESYTYTNNWPHEPLVGNVPTSSNIFWSIISIFLLLAALGGLIWWHAAKNKADDESGEMPKRDPLGKIELTPSMRAVAKYGVTAIILFALQTLLGAVTAHYTVEGNAFFGIPLAEYLPYSITRTWHIQLAMFWIATAFLATGLFLAPIISGFEPKFQRLGVNVLFGALLVIVVGSMAGEYLSIHQMLDLDMSFWFGTQGYEYVDLGRFWQIFLFAGLLIWLGLMLRCLVPALRKATENKSLLSLYTVSVVAIGLMYGAGLMYSARTHLTVAEYWRWWVIHLWVEGFFEVFATGVLAYVFSRLGLVRVKSATRAFLASTIIFLVAGIPGTFHHLYFSGTPISITAIGASFSALEVVPLVLIGFEAMQTLRMERRVDWMTTYKWPIRFFVAVAFWNLVGAGLFGFMINPPVALYFMQGLNTTPVHAHTALFGVYGLLSLGLILFMFRRLTGERAWKEGALRTSFWCMNGGLALMVLLSLLPIGLLQTWASVEHGLWYARSSEFLQSGLIENLRWLRIVGDTIFLGGVASLLWFMVGLKTGWSYSKPSAGTEQLPPNLQRA